VTLKFACLALFLGVLTPVPGIAVDYDREVAQLTAQHDKAVIEATYPIAQRYKEALEQLLKKATQAGELDAAVKIRQLLASMEGKAVQGHWETAKKTSQLEFTAGGNFQENWNGQVTAGRWKATSARDAQITLKNGTVYEYRVSEDGKSITRLRDGMTWIRKD
jgi:hypothetical protein